MFGLYLLLVYRDDIKRCAIAHNCMYISVKIVVLGFLFPQS